MEKLECMRIGKTTSSKRLCDKPKNEDWTFKKVGDDVTIETEYYFYRVNLEALKQKLRDVE